MKSVFIKWHRNDPQERKRVRKAAIRKAHRTIRQQVRLQLRCCDYVEFVHPRIRLGYFD